MDRLDQQQKCMLFQDLHKGPDILLLPNAWDAGSAVLMEQLGFPAVATTSAGIAFANGYSDNEVMGRKRMIENIARIVERVSIPVTADLEAGYGEDPESVAETIREAISAGAVGANIEDSSIELPGSLLPEEQSAERIAAAKEAIRNTKLPFLLNARVDVYLRQKHLTEEQRFEQTVRRAHAYVSAGADCIFIPAVPDTGTIRALVNEIDVPVNALGAYSGTSFPLDGLKKAGVKRVTIGGSLALFALTVAKRALEEMREKGTFTYAPEAMSNSQMNTLMSKKAELL